MRVRFWGVRGSIPTPATGEDVASRLISALLQLGNDPAPPDLRDREAVTRWVEALPPAHYSLAGGNTPCVEMTTDGGELFIIDFGSGLRALSDALMSDALMQGRFGRGQGRAHLFLSHFHWDHIQGWPFFRPAYVGGNHFDLYARHDGAEELLKKQQEAPFFPPAAWDEMRAGVEFHTLPDEAALLCDGEVRVSSLELDHPSRAFAFRFEADEKVFVYASDGAFPDANSPDALRFIEFFQDADLLIFDAQFSQSESAQKPDWGHSSGVQGVELACRAGVKRLALFHHSPGANEAHLEELLIAGKQIVRDPALPCQPDEIDVFVAREGVEVEL